MKFNNDVLLWHKKNWNYFCNAFIKDSIPGAILLYGNSGIGKKIFANQMAKKILCLNNINSEVCCGFCKDCKLMNYNSHPDLLNIALLNKSNSIKVDQIKSASNFLNSCSVISNNKVLIIEDACKLNINSANALLKSLEETKKGFFIILVCENYYGLPRTLLSRCLKINFLPVDSHLFSTFLKLNYSKKISSNQLNLLLKFTNSSPLNALNLLENNFFLEIKFLLENLLKLYLKKNSITEVTNNIINAEHKNVMKVYNLFFYELYKYYIFKKSESILINNSIARNIIKVIGICNPLIIEHFLDKINYYNFCIEKNYNFNLKILFDNFYMDCDDLNKLF